LDITGFRIGKQRLVSKKKKKSSLKKVIIEEREEKQRALELNGGGAAPTITRTKPDVNSMLSLDAPEFVPAGWSLDAEDAAPGKKEEGSKEAVGNEAADASPAKSPEAQKPRPKGATRSAAKAAPNSVKAAAAPALFIPSWCKDLQQEEEGAVAEKWPDEELPVAQAIEQMNAVKEKPAKSAREPKPKQPHGADFEVRHYVHQVLSEELDEKVKLMLSELVRFQERAKERDPLKFAKLKRYCVGMREARRSITRGKVKCLIMAPNLEASTAEGGLDDCVDDLIETARECEVPVVFALSRNRMGKALGKNIRMSIVALLSAEGVHQQFREVLKITDDLRRQWVLRHLSQVTSEDAEEARKRAEEKAVRDAERRIAKEKMETERREEEERKRLEAKALKQEEKARRAAERQVQIEKRRAEKAQRLAEEQAKKEGAEGEGSLEKRGFPNQAAKEERDKKNKEMEKKMEEERQRMLEERRRLEEEMERKQAEALAALGSDSDSDGSEDLPMGFNSALF